MTARVGVVTFPGSLDDRDALRAVGASGAEPVSLWHKDPSLHGVDAVVLPGGFSYGDYLRCGAIARFSPVMDLVIAGAREGLPVLGICNGFQVLCEAHLLPGALMRNGHLHFRCTDQPLVIENNATAWTNGYERAARAMIPVKNGEGRFVADDATLDLLEAEGRCGSPVCEGESSAMPPSDSKAHRANGSRSGSSPVLKACWGECAHDSVTRAGRPEFADSRIEGDETRQRDLGRRRELMTRDVERALPDKPHAFSSARRRPPEAARSWAWEKPGTQRHA